MRLRDLVLSLPTDARFPLFRRVAQAIVDAIQQGRLQAGQALPGTRALAEQLGVNRATVIQAIQELEAEGWLITEPNRGTFVADPLPTAGAAFGSVTPEPPSIRDDSQVMPGFDLPSRLKPLTQADSAVIDLSDGLPDATLAPSEELGKAYQRALQRHGNVLLQQGEPMGQPLLREQLAAWLSERRGLRVGPDQVLITRGSRSALTLIALSLLRDDDKVAVEHPGNRAAWDTLQQSVQVDLEPIPVDEDGMKLDVLDQAMKQKSFRAIFVMPQRQFPTTVTMSSERRGRLLTMAAEYRIPVIEDDLDPDFSYGDQCQLPLASQDSQGQVIYNTNLGRLIAPGIRMGCIVGSTILIDRLARVQRNLELQGDRAMEWAAADLIRDGDLGRQIRKARKIYEGRMHFLVAQLHEIFGSALDVREPKGGLALWIRFRDPELAAPWVDAMRIRGLVLNHPKTYFNGNPDPFTRMGFAQVPEDVIKAAVSRMKQALMDIS
jgi:GntR family transcriptional regulator/MocR family aminotransferase